MSLPFAAPYVTKVTTNIQAGQGRPTEVSLGQHTVVVGRNGAGKSRLSRACELALTGTISDALGRDSVSAAADLKFFAAPGTGPASATLFLSDGSRVSTEDAERIVNEWQLPVRKIRDGFKGGSDKVRTFLLPFVTQTVTPEDITGRLQKKYEGWTLPTSIDQMIVGIKEARDRSKQDQQHFQSNEILVQSLSRDLDAEPTDEDMRQATLAIERMREVVEQAVRASTLKNRVQIEADAVKARQDIAWMEANIDLVAPLPPEVSPPAPVQASPRAPDPMRELVTVAVSANDVTKAAGLRNCLACGGEVTVESLDNWRVQLDSIAGGYVAEDAAYAEQLRISQAAALEAARESHEAQVAATAAALEARAQAEAMIQQTKLDLAVKEQALALIAGSDPVSMPSLGEGITIEKAREMVDTAQDLHGQLIRLQQQWETVRSARVAVAAHKENADWWSKYADDLESVAWELLDTGVGIFRERVQRYMPPDRRFSLVLHDKTSDGKPRDVCRIGLERDGNVNLVLSGAEEAMVWLAMTVAILDLMPEPPAFALLVVPSEKAWHPEDLSSVMRALSSVPYQILLLSTTPPKRAFKDWTVLDLADFEPVDDTIPVVEFEEGSGEKPPFFKGISPEPAEPEKKRRKPSPKAVEAVEAPAAEVEPPATSPAPTVAPETVSAADGDWDITTFE
jgi:energy-coupling factor transporter ATP-binding protein EcfA2